VITNELKKRFIEMGIPPKTILVEPDAVDLDRFNISYDMSQLRSELRLPIKKHIITYAGSLQYGRGIEVIIECAKKMENIMLIIIGGKSEKVLSRYRNITNKINNIIFRGFVNQELIVKYLSASDILLMPHTEQCDIIKYTSPMKMFEYMASKKPIISSDLPVIREILNEKNALLISPSDSKAMGKAISNILSNKDYAKSLVSQAYKDVQNHTWIKRARRINRFMDHYD